MLAADRSSSMVSFSVVELKFAQKIGSAQIRLGHFRGLSMLISRGGTVPDVHTQILHTDPLIRGSQLLLGRMEFVTPRQSQIRIVARMAEHQQTANWLRMIRVELVVRNDTPPPSQIRKLPTVGPYHPSMSRCFRMPAFAMTTLVYSLSRTFRSRLLIRRAGLDHYKWHVA